MKALEMKKIVEAGLVKQDLHSGRASKMIEKNKRWAFTII